MHRLFKPKTIRRMLVFAAMMAPAVYLFGSQFFAFAGAHGQQLFADVNDPVTVVYSGSSLRTGNYSYETGNYNPTTNFFTTGIVSVEGVDYLEFGGSVTASSQRYYAVYDENREFVRGLQSFGSSCLSSITVTNASYVAVSFFSVAQNSAYWENPSVTFVYSDVAYSYSDYVFGQFFDKDNFLVGWGENAISEDPKGFAPFGHFWKYIDDNMLHLSDDQMGLMAYGYMYYAGHVLLFDVGFILVTFFLSFIQRMADKFGGDA